MSDIEQSGFRFDIPEVVEWQLTNEEAAFVIFLNITNLAPKARLITLSLATYVTSDREQFEQDCSITGYLTGHGRIKGGASRKCGLAFYKRHLTSVSPGDSLYIDVEVPDRALKLSLRFEKGSSEGNSRWMLCDSDVETCDVKPTPRVASRALTKGIERLEVFEEKLGIALDNLSLTISDDYRWLTVTGEVHLAGGRSLTQDIILVAVAYDSEGSILGSDQYFVSADKFLGLDVFKIEFWANDIGLLAKRIRVFPKPS
jgi:hypothetical protein